ncbi:MAG: hypothetical protein O9292_09375 [Rhodobacteraceae bacterium]|jgi:hypothetical protein|nr:hypothetical protein [Paracoccaceae bacterium]MCZ8152581.1 hypothetical protein [Paracoccaceae bacterium]MCZ8334315.1 hypothetical protein [Paracoccaceae bacterium]
MEDGGTAGTDSVVIDSGCDARSAIALHERLRADIAAASDSRPLRLDLSDDRPTAFALQLLAATAASLRRKGAFAGYGDHAAPLLDPSPTQEDPT